ncbi:hypothetical protein C499_15280 [Halogeometricum borinquense DSM 11551]|uniref:Endonuclease/exonuclease/phosphatase family protein n=1 Tax=Halogeometricum borinquense (strain ATCC 700274 / DSM 11551 / JCM 10706 / KCTC 4070 / PR3) TaxID=469382 RepID=E4NT87_HALBP|nr:endonuclease/exonuclease/phosphatase family protein [Halogeometricum borinquense]ADQ68184.1 endonuclease/exonuclease/phosphatase family protein [Halogeometricum borinquense DSM 11551]ELY24772.1 hypothetical protein C499_15280 [Halogeometricum borinquense DSM 11551]
MSPRDTFALSRRSVLRAGAAAGLGLTVPSVGAADQSRSTELTVATRNLGLGANLFALFLVESSDELARTIGDLYMDIERSAPSARMRAIADELARTRPDVVGVQEAALIRTETPGDGGEDGLDAEAVSFDFLDELTAALDETGTPYEVAQVKTTADAEFPGLVDDERIDVRLTDRDVFLVRSDADVTVSDSSAGTFDEALEIPVGDDRTFRVERGYGVISATADGREFTAVNTHLEASSESVRGSQADELASVLDDIDGRTVLLGDLNDGPAYKNGAYETLTSNLADAWKQARSDADGFTCCRSATLDGEESMPKRVDHVLVRSGVAATDAKLIGAGAESRLHTTVNGSSRTLWPSDHAGVVATLELGSGVSSAANTETGAVAETTATGGNGGDSTATPSDEDASTADDQSNESHSTTIRSPSSPSPSPSASPASSPGESGTATESPGFGPLVGALGVLAGVAERLRRRGD